MQPSYATLLGLPTHHRRGLQQCQCTPTVCDVPAHLLYEYAHATLQVRTVNAAFVLYAEHDLAASTFAARVTASTRSDAFSAITTAIGTLRGPLHGGANEAVMEMLEGLGSKEEVEGKVRDMLGRKQLIMGFGHRICAGDNEIGL